MNKGSHLSGSDFVAIAEWLKNQFPTFFFLPGTQAAKIFAF